MKLLLAKTRQAQGQAIDNDQHVIIQIMINIQLL